jgi:hypothetical protein
LYLEEQGKKRKREEGVVPFRKINEREVQLYNQFASFSTLVGKQNSLFVNENQTIEAMKCVVSRVLVGCCLRIQFSFFSVISFLFNFYFQITAIKLRKDF